MEEPKSYCLASYVLTVSKNPLQKYQFSAVSTTFAGMGFAATIKQRWARMQLKTGAPREKKVTGLNRAKRIGILYDATDREIFECVRELILELRGQHKEVSSLGFVNVKKGEEIPKSKLGMDFFGPKSLNFGLKSSDMAVANFTKDRFDLLMDLNLDESPILLHVTAESKAHFIVGTGDAGRSFRDLYFEEKERPAHAAGRDTRLKQLRELIDHIKTYTAEL